MQQTDQALQALSALAYESIGEADRFGRYLDHLRHVMGVQAVTLLTPVPKENDRLLCWQSGLSEQLCRDYVTGWHQQDAWAQTWVRKGLSLDGGHVRAGHEYLPHAELVRTDFFHHFSSQYDLWNLCSLIIDNGVAAPLTALAIHHGKGRPEFSDADKAFLGAIHRPLQRALRAYWALEALRGSEQSLEALLAAQPFASLVLNGRAKICYANPAAEELVKSGVIACSALRGLERVAQLTAEELRVLVTAASRGTVQDSTLWVLRPNGLATGRLYATRLPRQSIGSSVWRDATVLVNIQWAEPASQRDVRLHAMARLHRFTPAELTVLRLLSHGMSAREVAEDLQVSMSTVRTHVRHLIAKSGQRRLMDLLRVLGPNGC